MASSVSCPALLAVGSHRPHHSHHDRTATSFQMNDPARPYEEKDIAIVDHFATIALGALAPALQDINLADSVKVDCVAADIARACYAMGVCMLEQHELLKQSMIEVNDELFKKQ